MTEQVGRTSQKRSKPSYIYSIISITLVLFMIGVLGHVIFFSQKISAYLRENIQVSIILDDDLSDADIFQFQKKLEREPYIKNTEFISKEEAAVILKKEFGEDIDLLGHNPLYASIDVHLNADYANTDSLILIEESLLSNNEVKEVYYFRAIVDLINKNINRITLILIVISSILIVVAITLIDNTIKLAMYSNRFLIKSMQLVGATRWFIIKPFIERSIFNGAVSGLVAVIGLVGLLYYVQQHIPRLILSDELINFASIFIAVLFSGIFITWISTHRAVSKYLKLKLDDLY